jgi:hypothetical protein
VSEPRGIEQNDYSSPISINSWNNIKCICFRGKEDCKHAQLPGRESLNKRIPQIGESRVREGRNKQNLLSRSRVVTQRRFPLLRHQARTCKLYPIIKQHVASLLILHLPFTHRLITFMEIYSTYNIFDM